MRKLLLAACALFALSAFGEAWYMKGDETMKNKTMKEWRMATDEDYRLAEAGTMLWTLQNANDMGINPNSQEFLEMAIEIKTCLDTGNNDGSIDHTDVSEAAVLCFMMLK